MKKFFKRLGITVLLIIALFLIIPLFMSTDYIVTRSIEVNSNKEIVKTYMKDFTQFENWSPWKEMDPDMKVEFEGTTGEVGSIYKWKGNEDVGEGSMEITKITDDTVFILLKFIEPFESESETYYAFNASDEKTKVTWGMEGEMPYPWNIMHLFMSMEEQIGKDFEKGLNKFKPLVESEISLQPEANSYTIQEIDFAPRTYIGIQDTVSWKNMQEFYATNLPKTFEYVAEKQLEMAGAPSGLYFMWDEEGQRTLMAATIPLQSGIEVEAPFQTWDLEGKALMVDYYGNYEELGGVHENMEQYMIENELGTDALAIEEYVTDPGEEPDTSKWLTKVYYLLK